MRRTDMELDREVCADAVRDAAALIRAATARDGEAVDAVAGNLTHPALTAAVLAGWLADFADHLGLDPLPALANWQGDAGL